ncbi:MAG TPA: hypothetical protein VFI41_05420 [Gemmatimonadales bacterium]|nr:hypothetical protein [Gemmatimonadales bacterium]
MTALPTILVAGDGSLGTWSGSYTAIDEQVASANDADFVSSGAAVAGQAFYQLQDMPSDFDTMTTLTAVFRYSQSGRSNDTMGLFAQVFAADETTPLTNEVTISSAVTNTAWSNTSTLTFTGVVAGDKATWDGARIRLRNTFSQSQSKDASFIVRVSALQLGGTYVSSVPPVPVTASDTLGLTMTGSTDLQGIAPLLSENFESASLSISVVSGSWVRTTAQAQSGSYSFTNPDITDSQTADEVITIPSGATQVSLSYIVSSEGSWDYFRVLADGVQLFQDSGNSVTTWRQIALDVTGKSQLTLRYMKDGSQTVGADAAYVDDLVFSGPAPIGPPPDPVAGSDASTLTIAESSSLGKAGYQQLFPDAILVQTNIAGAVTAIDEDPDSPDANWLTGSGAIELRVSFPSPTNDLQASFPQEFRVRVRPGT